MGQQTKRGYALDQDGKKVQDLLYKIDDIEAATQNKDGLMVAKDKELVDSKLTYLEIDELLNL